MIASKKFLTVGTLLSLLIAHSSASSLKSLDETLSAGGFSGTLDEHVQIKSFGCLHSELINSICVYYYTREFGNKRLTQRLIITSDQNGYEGMYNVPDEPITFEHGIIKFPYDADDGALIDLSTGEIPERIFLDGESFVLFK
ncbi:hypothetical protein KUW19_03255 [Ferrimonas balearica]|uniref:hypothetical protein n=1 Tax=Ferrimonas balearica TaxID=44012 RepID=UPI001C957C62|nr:hypothetical protein [Ferrimonas balearica]MBY6105504.1 hypothetical protein [Ferrimonas balearica]